MDEDECERHGVPPSSCAPTHVADALRLERARADGCERLLQAAVTDAQRHATHAHRLRDRCEHLASVLDVLRHANPDLVAAAEDEVEREARRARRAAG